MERIVLQRDLLFTKCKQRARTWTDDFPWQWIINARSFKQTADNSGVSSEKPCTINSSRKPAVVQYLWRTAISKEQIVLCLFLIYRASVTRSNVLVNGPDVEDVTSKTYDCITANVLSFGSASRLSKILTRLSAQRFFTLEDKAAGMEILVNSSTALTRSSVAYF